MKVAGWICLGLVAASIAGCGSGSSTADNSGGSTTAGTSSTSGGAKPLVVFSQANSRDPWRKVFDAETEAAAEAHTADFDFEMQTADGDASKQNNIVETFLLKKPKVLLISPTEVSVQKSVEKAYDAGVAVILLDRAIGGDKYTTWIGGDNKEIGRQAGEYLAKRLSGKGTVLMIRGIANATPTHDRADGAMESFKKYPGIKIIVGDDCGYERIKARNYMESFLQSGKPFDAVYAHNDEMAIGASLAMDAAKTPKKIVVGIDGCQQEVVDLIKVGKIDATFQYPTPGARGIEVAAGILKGQKPEKKIVLPTTMVTKETADDFVKKNPNLAK